MQYIFVACCWFGLHAECWPSSTKLSCAGPRPRSAEFWGGGRGCGDMLGGWRAGWEREWPCVWDIRAGWKWSCDRDWDRVGGWFRGPALDESTRAAGAAEDDGDDGGWLAEDSEGMEEEEEEGDCGTTVCS